MKNGMAIFERNEAETKALYIDLTILRDKSCRAKNASSRALPLN